MIDSLTDIFASLTIIDLSPTIENGMPRWPGDPDVHIERSSTYEKDGYFCQTVTMGEHTGSHVDAPAHMIAAMADKSIDTYPPEMIIGPAVVYHLSSLGLKPGERVSLAQIIAIEESMEYVPGAGDIALFDFGWMKYWSTGEYFATNAPGLDEEVTQLFVKRRVRAVGSDTASCDMPVKDGKPSYAYGHEKHWLPNEIFIIEMLANLELIENRCFFIALPLKIKGGSGSPIRPIALIPR